MTISATNSMFLLSVPPSDEDASMIPVGLFISDAAAHAYMEQFQTVWVFKCEQFRKTPVEANGPFHDIATSAEEIIARYPGKDIKVYGKTKNPKAYKMNRPDIENGFSNYEVVEIPVL